jgi:hypothetical protein
LEEFTFALLAFIWRRLLFENTCLQV